MDMTVTIVPLGNTTKQELAVLAGQMAEGLRGLRAVEQVSPVQTVAPDGAKGVAEELGSFLINLPPAAITGVFGVLRGVLARAPETPTKVHFSADGGIDFEYDPRHTTPEQMTAMIDKLRPAHPGG